MREQERLRNEMQYQYRLGNMEVGCLRYLLAAVSEPTMWQETFAIAGSLATWKVGLKVGNFLTSRCWLHD
jgi:hypothetical protein